MKLIEYQVPGLYLAICWREEGFYTKVFRFPTIEERVKSLLLEFERSGNTPSKSTEIIFTNMEERNTVRRYFLTTVDAIAALELILPFEMILNAECESEDVFKELREVSLTNIGFSLVTQKIQTSK